MSCIIWCISSATVNLEALWKQRDSALVLCAVQRKRRGKTCRACRQPKACSITHMWPSSPSCNAPCIVTQAGKLADRQRSPEHSAVRYCTHRALRGCGSLLPMLFVYCCQTWSHEGCSWCSLQHLPLIRNMPPLILWDLVIQMFCWDALEREMILLVEFNISGWNTRVTLPGKQYQHENYPLWVHFDFFKFILLSWHF